MPSLAHLCILLSGFFCEVGVGGRGVMGGDHLNFQMGTRPEKSLARSLKAQSNSKKMQQSKLEKLHPQCVKTGLNERAPLSFEPVLTHCG